MNIVAQPLLYKYDIGADGDMIFPFKFDILLDTCTANYLKVYDVVVTKKSDSSVVSAPSWISLCTTLPCPRPAVTTTPSVTVNSAIVADEGIYIITIGSKLYNESAFSPTIVLEVNLHPSPCIHTELVPTNPSTWTKCAD
jgi:hypothetical protein